MKPKWQWKRDPLRNWIYHGTDGRRVSEIERHNPGDNSHISLWTIRGFAGHFLTLRDAKAMVERIP